MQQIDAPIDMYERPRNTFVAGFIGSPPMNLLPAEWGEGGLHLGGQRLVLPEPLAARLAGQPHLTVGVRPEAFTPVEAGGSGLRVVPDAETAEVLGGETLVRAALGEQQVTVRLFGLARGIPETVEAPLEQLHFFDASGERIGARASRPQWLPPR